MIADTSFIIDILENDAIEKLDNLEKKGEHQDITVLYSSYSVALLKALNLRKNGKK
ncbi:MAG TPA: hypothetical protein VJH88_00030 [Candidatus Nanoarchaeia archaeon]|nr:hypothetical protein [Candidatus Nanoarchaeia archaeon]